MSKINELVKNLCPNGVEYKKICDVCNVVGRIGFRGYKREDQVEKGNGAISLSPSNIINGKINYNECTYISWDKYNESPEIMVNEGDVIFCKTASVGKTCYIENMPEKATINPQLILLKNISINSKYLSYCLQTKDFQIKANSIKGLGTIPTLSQKDFNELTVPIPPLEVQEEIVRILDKFDKLEAELETELEARKSQYEFWRGNLINVDAQKYKLNEIANIYDGTHSTPDYRLSGVQFISVENINDIYNSNKFISKEDYDKYKIKPTINDVFMTRIGSVGKCAVFEKQVDLAYYVSLALIRPNNNIISSRYLKYYLESRIGRDELYKKTLTHAVPIKINKDDIGKINVIVLSKEEQRRIVDILDKFDALVNDITEGIPAEIELRRQQFEYYRNKLLSFEELNNE